MRTKTSETAKRHYTSLNTLYRITFNRRSIDERERSTNDPFFYSTVRIFHLPSNSTTFWAYDTFELNRKIPKNEIISKNRSQV